MRALHTGATGLHGARQIKTDVTGSGDLARNQALGLGAGEFVLELGVLAGHHTDRIHQKNQFVGVQCHRSGSGNVLKREIENLACRRIADRREQYQFVVIQTIADTDRVDLAHFTGVHQINTVEYANRLGGDEITARHTDIGARHRRIRQSHRQQRLDLHAHAPAGLFRARQGDIVGDPQAVGILRAMAELL